MVGDQQRGRGVPQPVEGDLGKLLLGQLSFVVCRKPLARRVVPKKACADDEDRKTPFVVK